jgi:hypothetical protein
LDEGARIDVVIIDFQIPLIHFLMIGLLKIMTLGVPRRSFAER